MKKNINENKIAILTGTAIQDDESYKSDGGFIPERDQYYFELKQNDNTFMIGFKDMLKCLKLLENMNEIPKIDGKWWGKIASLYGDDILMVNYEENG